MFEFAEAGGGDALARIKVVGVGGAGGNVINNMVASQIKGVEFIAMNTDAQVLEKSLAHRKLQIGQGVTRGLGAGSRPEVGRDSAIEDKDRIADMLEGADMVFITAGMGGGTGTGAAPVVAEIARSLGALTVGVVTKPFFYEGGVRKRNAEGGLAELRKHADTMIVIPNDRISLVVEKGTPILKSFEVANDVLRNAVRGISDLIMVPGLINLDYADVRTVMQDSGRAVIGMGIGRGEGAAHDAAKRAVLNPLLENNSIEGAEGIIINVTGGLTLSMNDLQEATAPIHDSAPDNANIMVGAVIDPDLRDEVRVTIVATKFPVKEERAEAAQSVEIQQVKKWIPAPAIPAAPARPAMSATSNTGAGMSASLRGADRILAKTLGMTRKPAEQKADQVDLDIPAFMRRTPQQAADART